MAELIHESTLAEWEAHPVRMSATATKRLIAAYRESRAMQAQHLEHAQILWEEKGAWEARARKAEADLAALRVGIEALVTEWDQPHYHRAVAGNLMRSLRALLSTSTDQPDTHPSHYSTPVGHPGAAADCHICPASPPSTDQPEGEPACGNPDCTMHHHGEA